MMNMQDRVPISRSCSASSAASEASSSARESSSRRVRTATAAPPRTTTRERRRRRQRDVAKDGGGGSVIWTLLMIGLVFCLLDVAYMMGKMEATTTNPSSSSSFNSGVQEMEVQHQQASPAQQARISNELQESSEVESPVSRPKIPSKGGDKTRILKLLEEAGVPIDPIEDKDIYEELPTWEDVVSLYGDHPVIVGMEQCFPFQMHSDAADHFVSTAGTFNSGTNLMAELLIANCHMPARMKKYGYVNRGIRWQVPWGKHTPPDDEEFRQSHKTEKDKKINANDILPAVTVRDPLVWLKSMCRHTYGAHWDVDQNHCPNFGDDADTKVYVKYSDFKRYHDSILGLWNDYYNLYLNATFSRLLVRFEDLVFHPKEVTTAVCTCAGGEMRKDGKFLYVVDSAKKGVGAHGKHRTGYLDAIIKYGSPEKRYKGYRQSENGHHSGHRQDLEYIREHVDANLMKLMNYPMPNPEEAEA